VRCSQLIHTDGLQDRAPCSAIAAAPGDHVGDGMHCSVQQRWVGGCTLSRIDTSKETMPDTLTSKPGVLRMNAFPDSDDESCFAGPVPSANSIKALCNVAVKVTVSSSGVVKWAPIVQDSYGFGGPGPYVNLTTMNCKDHNASGLFRSES
jgi:hypothetical protein